MIPSDQWACANCRFFRDGKCEVSGLLVSLFDWCATYQLHPELKK